MGIEDRLTWLIIGCVVGFFAGYITKALRDIKEELDEVDEIVKEDHQEYKKRHRNEDGLMRNYHPVIANVALLVVLLLTVWASFSSQKASNDVQDAQDRIDQVTKCNAVYLSRTIAALNERTTFTRNQASKNVKLQKAQYKMLIFLIHKPPYPEPERQQAVRKYVRALTKFVEAGSKSEDVANANPYPTDEDFTNCVQEDGG